MEDSRDDLSARLQELSRAYADLERRVHALEREPDREPAPELPLETAGPAPAVLAGAGGGEAIAGEAANLAPLIGYAFLGLAGAYLLRALTESGAIPRAAGAAVGVLYAAWWLYLAARRAGERPLFSTVHGLTAALILAPLLWEMTVRFRLLNAWTASAVLAGFAVWALAVGWRRNLTAIAWIGAAAGLVTATALYRETHDAGAWAATMLLIAVAVEFSACRDHWLSLRWIVAFAADLTVLLLLLLATRPAVPGVFTPPSPGLVLGAQIALLTIYLSSTVDRTILRGLHICRFEIAQAAAAFLISVGGALHLANVTRVPPTAVGLFCLLGGTACYLVSFAFLEHREGRERNFYTYSTFAILLIGVACRVLLDGAAVVAAWSALAVALMCVGILGQRTTLRVHAAVYLLLAAVSAGLLPLAFDHTVRQGPQAALPPAAAYLAACAGALACYAVIATLGRRTTHWTDAVEAILSAALFTAGLAGLLASAFPASTAYRTAVVVILAGVAAWVGNRWQRRELVWLVYPLMTLAAVKLVIEDLHAGSHTLVLSLVFFGGALVLLPRLLRRAPSGAPGAGGRQAEG
jgi:hypothetical protein